MEIAETLQGNVLRFCLPNMKIYTTALLEDPREARTIYKELEDIGYDGGFSFEAKHDPFLALAVAAEHSTTLRLGTAITITFARNPMNLAKLGYDMQSISGGRFFFGLGSQVKPHIEKRFSSGPIRPNGCGKSCWPSRLSGTAGRARRPSTSKASSTAITGSNCLHSSRPTARLARAVLQIDFGLRYL